MHMVLILDGNSLSYAHVRMTVRGVGKYKYHGSIQIHFVVLDPNSVFWCFEPDPYFSPWVRIHLLVLCIPIFSRLHMDLFIVLFHPDPFFYLDRGLLFLPHYNSFLAEEKQPKQRSISCFSESC